MLSIVATLDEFWGMLPKHLVDPAVVSNDDDELYEFKCSLDAPHFVTKI